MKQVQREDLNSWNLPDCLAVMRSKKNTSRAEQVEFKTIESIYAHTGLGKQIKR